MIKFPYLIVFYLMVFIACSSTKELETTQSCPLENPPKMKTLIGYILFDIDSKDDFKNCHLYLCNGNQHKVEELIPRETKPWVFNAEIATTLSLDKIICETKPESKLKFRTISEHLSLKKINFSKDSETIGFFGSVRILLKTKIDDETRNVYSMMNEELPKEEGFHSLSVSVTEVNEELNSLSTHLAKVCPFFLKNGYQVKPNTFQMKK